MTRRLMLMLLAILVCSSSCSDDASPAPLPPDGTSSDGLWLMRMNDCIGDCEEPGVGMGGRFYYAWSCEPIDETHLGDLIAVADPTSVIGVPYDLARPIAGIDVEQAVAVGHDAPSACDSRDLRGWFAARSQDYLLSNDLNQQLRGLAPGG